MLGMWAHDRLALGPTSWIASCSAKRFIGTNPSALYFLHRDAWAGRIFRLYSTQAETSEKAEKAEDSAGLVFAEAGPGDSSSPTCDIPNEYCLVTGADENASHEQLTDGQCFNN